MEVGYRTGKFLSLPLIILTLNERIHGKPKKTFMMTMHVNVTSSGILPLVLRHLQTLKNYQNYKGVRLILSLSKVLQIQTATRKTYLFQHMSFFHATYA